MVDILANCLHCIWKNIKIYSQCLTGGHTKNNCVWCKAKKMQWEMSFFFTCRISWLLNFFFLLIICIRFVINQWIVDSEKCERINCVCLIYNKVCSWSNVKQREKDCARFFQSIWWKANNIRKEKFLCLPGRRFAQTIIGWSSFLEAFNQKYKFRGCDNDTELVILWKSLCLLYVSFNRKIKKNVFLFLFLCSTFVF